MFGIIYKETFGESFKPSPGVFDEQAEIIAFKAALSKWASTNLATNVSG